jgi:hypothetical protein
VKHNLGRYEIGARGAASFIGRSYWDPQNSAEQRAYHLVNLAAWVEHDFWKGLGKCHQPHADDVQHQYWPSYDVDAPFNIARINRPREFIVSGSVRF